MRFDKGYVKLHRKIEDSWIANDGVALAIWTTLLRWARYRQGGSTLVNGKIIELKPGQVVTSAKEIASKLKFGRMSVERRLNKFIECGSIVQQVSTHGRIITLCNWDKYNGLENDGVQPVSSNRAASEQPVSSQRAHSEEREEGKNEKRKEDIITIVADAPQNDTPNLSPRKLVELWNQHSALNQPKVRLDSFSAESKRYKAAKLRLAKKPDLEYWTEVIKKIAASDWCTGQTNRGNWVATFDWLIKPETHTKVMEGQYDNRNAQDNWTRPEGFLDEQPF